jgi:hypothetical protein
MSVENVLNERGLRYGQFRDHALISQSLKTILNGELKKRDKSLSSDQMEALEMIFHKIARIVNGDSEYIDSWVDIAGYATLVANRLTSENG